MHRAGAGVEVAFVARAVPAVLVGLVVDDAAEVGALLAERHDLAVGDAQQDRRVVVGRVPEQVGVADGDVVERDDRRVARRC